MIAEARLPKRRLKPFRGVLSRGKRSRSGASTLDYVLLLCIVLPMAAFVMWAGPRIMNLVYEMSCVLISWPFL